MKKVKTLGFAALSVIAAPLHAQQGGGPAGGAAQQPAGGSTTPARPQPPQATDAERRALRQSTYLNSGDYATASALNAVDFGLSNTDGDVFLRSLVGPSPLAGHPVTDGVTGRPTGERSDWFLRDAQRNAGSGEVANRTPGPPGSRPTSNYERQQTALLQQRYATLESAYQTANRLVDLSETAAPSYRANAIQVRNDLARARDNFVNAINITNTYDGRTFQSEGSASLFLQERTGATLQVQENDPVAPLQALLNSMVPGGVQGGRYTRDSSIPQNDNMANAEAIQSSLDRLSIQVSTQQHTAGQFQIEEIAGRQASSRISSPGVAVANPSELLAMVRAASNRYHDPLAPRGGLAGNGASGASPASSSAGAQAGRTAAAAAAQIAGGSVQTQDGTRPTPSRTPNNPVSPTQPVTPTQIAEDNTPPRPVPTTPDYPTVSAEERARISREAAQRREAQAAQAAAASAAQRAQQAAAAREAAERAAMVERSRVADENYRIFQNAQRQAAQDERWRQMVEARFAPNASIVDRNYAYAEGQSIRMTNLEQIYGGSNYRDGNVMRSMSAAGTGPSSVSNSLSSAGTSMSSVAWSLSSAGTDWRDPALESLHDAMGYFNYRSRSNPWQSGMDGDPARAAQMAYNAGSFDVRFNRDGREGRESGGYLAANLFTFDDPYLRLLTANGFTGLDSLLAQPFNVVLTWGQGAYDLDLHMTGPLGETTSNRFHIYYSATGNLEAQPFAALIKDCICSAGSEVILTSALNRGGVYRVSVFNFGDQSATSTNLSGASQAQIQIVRGGTTQSVGNGTTIVGGRVIVSTTVPTSGAGNTWVAAELDPRNGRITVPGRITQSPGSGGVE